MKYTMAPMEGIGGFLYRNVQESLFPGADSYYAPFITTTEKDRVASHYLTDLLPVNNRVNRLVPQIMANDAGAFLRMADKVKELGYDEVNLNLGCPSGTVTKKGRGAGFLGEREKLAAFLDAIFAVDHGYAISIKTRVGIEDEDEIDQLIPIFASYPIRELTIHPRLLRDGYKHDVRLNAFEKAYRALKCPVQYNGDIRCANDRDIILKNYDGVSGVMIGRGALADPAIFRTMKGGLPLERQELLVFSQTLEDVFLRNYRSRHTVTIKMKEVWVHLSESFDNCREPFRALLKAQNLEELNIAVTMFLDEAELIPGRIRGIYL